MKVILIESVANLGLPGDIIDVKNGYARNYLLPQRKAMLASSNNVVELEHKKRIAESRRKKVMDDLKVRCQNMHGAELHFKERMTESGKLYGSVTARRIADALAEQFGPIETAWVQLGEVIKTPGKFTVALKLAPGITGSIKVTVEGERAVEEAPAEAPAAEGDAAAANEAAADVQA